MLRYYSQAELDRRPKYMVSFIDAHQADYGVEPICAQLPVARGTVERRWTGLGWKVFARGRAAAGFGEAAV